MQTNKSVLKLLDKMESLKQEIGLYSGMQSMGDIKVVGNIGECFVMREQGENKEYLMEYNPKQRSFQYARGIEITRKEVNFLNSISAYYSLQVEFYSEQGKLYKYAEKLINKQELLEYQADLQRSEISRMLKTTLKYPNENLYDVTHNYRVYYNKYNQQLLLEKKITHIKDDFSFKSSEYQEPTYIVVCQYTITDVYSKKDELISSRGIQKVRIVDRLDLIAVQELLRYYQSNNYIKVKGLGLFLTNENNMEVPLNNSDKQEMINLSNVQSMLKYVYSEMKESKQVQEFNITSSLQLRITEQKDNNLFNRLIYIVRISKDQVILEYNKYQDISEVIAIDKLTKIERAIISNLLEFFQ